jgi:hypothetical protein
MFRTGEIRIIAKSWKCKWSSVKVNQGRFWKEGKGPKQILHS